MAGIGFELRRLFEKDTLSSSALGYAGGTALALGPFLSSVFCIGILSFAAGSLAGGTAAQVFTSAVVYVFGGTLVLGAPLQVVLTRYLADQTYKGRNHTVVDSAVPALVLVNLVVGPAALCLLWRLQLSPFEKTCIWALAMSVTCLWLLSALLTSADCHWSVVRLFIAGTAIAMVAAVALMPWLSLSGLLCGYALGHVAAVALCLRRLVQRLGLPQKWDWGVLTYCERFPALLAVGFLQTLGVWIDKFIFWSSDLSLEAAGLVTAPKYDSSTFLGFVTALPAIVHFFVRLESDISVRFHKYFDDVFFRATRRRIEQRAHALRMSVLNALVDIIKVQGAVSFVAAFYAESILRLCGLPVSQLGMVRYAILGALFYSLIMFSNVVLLYLDRQRDALRVSALFCIVNAVTTWLSLHAGYEMYGAGFATSALLGAIAALFTVATQLHHLTYYTFATMPVVGQRRASPGLRARQGGGFGVYQPTKC